MINQIYIICVSRPCHSQNCLFSMFILKIGFTEVFLLLLPDEFDHRKKKKKHAETKKVLLLHAGVDGQWIPAGEAGV